MRVIKDGAAAVGDTLAGFGTGFYNLLTTGNADGAVWRRPSQHGYGHAPPPEELGMTTTYPPLPYETP